MSLADWPQVALGDIFQIVREQISPRSQPETLFVHYSIPVWDETTGPALESGRVIESNKTAIRTPSVLVSKLNPRKPRVAVVESPGVNTCCSTEFICYQPKSTDENLPFWGVYFSTGHFARSLERVAAGSTNSHTRANPGETLKWIAQNPSLEEKRLIVSVLNAVDTTIRQTGAILEKLLKFKQGLLHDLLTRGIDENGELRPPQDEVPHLYEWSPLGWIPKGWEVDNLLRLSSTDRQPILTGPFGAELGAQDFVEHGSPVLRIGNVQWGYLDLTNLRHIRKEKARQLEKYRVLEGDLLFARQGATTGRNALADARVHGYLINYHIIRVALDRARCEPVFVYSAFNSPLVQSQVDREKGGGTREGVNSATLSSFRLPISPMPEQRRFREVVMQLDARIEREKREAECLLELKKGLMSDLLVGRVRVTRLLRSDSESLKPTTHC